MALVATCLSCGADSTEPARLGDIEVTLRTNGGDLDLDGYVLTVDQIEHTPVAANQTLVVQQLPAGSHAIGLANVAGNCDVAGENPRIVTIQHNATVTAAFDVQCYATGVLVEVTQSGADPDEDGFTVTVDEFIQMSVQGGATQLISRLTPGPHNVGITGVADNCTVPAGSGHLVTVEARAIESVLFEVQCQAVTGSIEVVITTTGEDADFDGYRVVVDTLPEHPVSVNDSIVIAKLTPGNYMVRLDQIASNCSTLGAGELDAAVGVGAITRVEFEVTCSRFEAILFSRGWGTPTSIWLARTDGSEERRLFDGSHPTWHPDGQRFAFHLANCPPVPTEESEEFCPHTLVTVSLGSPTPSPVLPTPIVYSAMDWSPDGGSIVTSSLELYIVGLSNAPPLPLEPIDIVGHTGVAKYPVWSPDGTRIAFTCWFDTKPDICLTKVDGSALWRLTDHPESDSHPAWSPDGTQLAFATERDRPGVPAIAIMNVDGSGFREITDGTEPWWSPDGTRLVVRKVAAPPGLYLVNVDGSGLVRLTMDASDGSPRWRP